MLPEAHPPTAIFCAQLPDGAGKKRTETSLPVSEVKAFFLADEPVICLLPRFLANDFPFSSPDIFEYEIDLRGCMRKIEGAGSLLEDGLTPCISMDWLRPAPLTDVRRSALRT